VLGGTRKPDLPEAFYERRTREFGGESGALPPQKKNYECGIGGDAISRCLEGFTCTLQSLLSRYSIPFSIIPPHPTLTISTQMWTNYETHIFKKWGYVPPRPVWLRQCHWRWEVRRSGL